MTIDEAISKYRNRVEQYKDWENMKDIVEEHEQLAEWLEELKSLKSLETSAFVVVGKTKEEFAEEIRNKAIDDVFDFLKNKRDKKYMKISFDDMEIRKYKEQLKEGGVE